MVAPESSANSSSKNGVPFLDSPNEPCFVVTSWRPVVLISGIGSLGWWLAVGERGRRLEAPDRAAREVNEGLGVRIECRCPRNRVQRGQQLRVAGGFARALGAEVFHLLSEREDEVVSGQLLPRQ